MVTQTNITVKRRFEGQLDKLTDLLICVYFVISVFEPYINGTIGSITKYYIFAVMAVVLINAGLKMKIRSFHIAYVFWLLYKILSLIWSKDLSTPQLHFVSQVGMVLFLIVITSIDLHAETIKKVVFTYFLSSGLMGVCTLLFAQSYRGVAESRQVLVLFGQEADPNNQAAFLIIGVCIALYYLLIARKHWLLSAAVLLINVYTCLKTASRASLVALVCVIFLSILLTEKKNTLSSWLKKLILIVLIGAVMFLVIRFLPDNVYERLFDFSGYKGGSNRNILWDNAWNLYTRDLMSILFGTGWGTATVSTGMTIAVHNTFLTMLCDVGLFGMLLFLIPIILASVKLVKNKTVFPVLLLVGQFIPAFFIDAINKRFFWNAIILLFMYYANQSRPDNMKKE